MESLALVLLSMEGVNLSFGKFISGLVGMILSTPGRLTFRNLSRNETFEEHTISRWYKRDFAFEDCQLLLLEQCVLTPSSEVIAVIDCTFVPKSGKKTEGLGKFWCSSTSRAERGLEVSVVGLVIDGQGYGLSARQTPATCTDEENRIDFFNTQIADCLGHISAHTRYLVADGFYTKKKFIDYVDKQGLYFIGKLRQDAHLRYPYLGERSRKKGRPKTYDGKFSPQDLSRLEMIAFEDRTFYTGILYHNGCQRWVRVVVEIKPKGNYTLFFSTDTSLCPLKIVRAYQQRFQIEFVFRDAKQHAGFGHCQSTQAKKQHFHWNASLLACNVAKIEQKGQAVFSMTNVKRKHTNLAWVKRLIRTLGLDHQTVLNHPKINKLLEFSLIAN